MTKELSPGWYIDPENPQQNRYWDGQQWSHQLSTDNEQSLADAQSYAPEGLALPPPPPTISQKVEQAAERQSNKLQIILGIAAIMVTIAAVPILKAGDLPTDPSGNGCFTQGVTTTATLAAVVVMAVWAFWLVVSISSNLRLAGFYGADIFLIFSGIGSILFAGAVYGSLVLLRDPLLLFFFGLPAGIGLLLYVIGLVVLLVKVASKQPLGQQPALHLTLISLSQGMAALLLAAYGPLLHLGTSVSIC